MYKIAVLHRYPVQQVLGTNASFLEFIKSLISKESKVYYLTYKDSGISPEIEGLTYIRLPFTFNRGDNRDKLIKTLIWIALSPFYVLYMQVKYSLDLVYCDDSVPYYGFLSKLLSPFSKVVIRLGDLQTGYSLSDSNPDLFKLAIFFETLMWKYVDGLVAISKPFKRYLVSLGIEDKKIEVVEESINLSNRVSFEVLERDSSNINLLFHGALLKCKGVETLIEALEILNNSKTKRFTLTIAGGGDEEHSLKTLVQEKGLQNVKFTGWYNHQKLDEIMKNTDISIVMRSTNMANNFVVTTCLLENWAAGKPVIAPNLESFRGVIDNWKNGVLFEAGNANDLASKIMELSIQKEAWTNMAIEGIKSAEKYFDHKMIANKMSNSLVSLIKSNEK